ncbi:myb/SANT-like DNA-binding domain-containing protein 3 isoform X2 [Odontomachus brunneus]|uniref:myb/SANT-like DNA-binding domain-containing protein 3 isoform X2 n=1 Tax=Odontomachus brunneus TaxID=486640 RepID=UPI0013F1AFDF|nr:myb/SANT-like DNA-binding domain-containing protein 3 isoform X2 [Odontomachus brunneus]
MDKEKRGANFTKTEIDLLIDVTLKYKHIVENKKTDATTWKDKNEAWEKISNEFNAASGNFPRSIKTIRSKYDTIKKSIRKKCSLLKSEQTKTGGGQCAVTLTPSEEKVLSLTPNTMVGLKSRFDNDSEACTSNVKQWMTQQDVEDESELRVTEDLIEFLEDGDDSVLQFLKRTEKVEVPQATLIIPEKSENIEKTSLKRKIDTAHFVHENKENKTQKGTDNKFI